MRRFKTSRYNYCIKEGSTVVLHNFLTRALIEISAESYNAVETLLQYPNSNVFEDDDLLLLLCSQGFLVPSNLNEIDVVKYRYYSSLFGNGANQLRLIILPTMWCNLRCPYCFETKRKEFMQEETQHRLCEFVDYKLRYAKNLYVAWFGGEPLLCRTTIERLTRTLQGLCERHHCGYAAGMTTNGCLLDVEFINSLGELGIRSLQITFDGAPGHHNTYRTLPDGKGTFEIILKNTEDFCRLTGEDIRLLLRINCSSDNFKEIPSLLRLFSMEVKKRASLFFRWIYPTEASGFRDFTYGIPKQGRFSILAELSRKAIESGWSVDDPCNTTSIYCEVDSTNFFQIAPNGDVFLCSESYPPEESIGNLSDWRSLVSLPRYEWYAANPFDDGDCQQCILLPYCMGGCRKARVLGKKSCVEELNDIDALVRVLYHNFLKQQAATT